MIKRTFALFLACIMLLNSVPVQAFATGQGDSAEYCTMENCVLKAEPHEICDTSQENPEDIPAEEPEEQSEEQPEEESEEQTGEEEIAPPSEAVAALVAKLEALPSADMVTEELSDEVRAQYSAALEDAIADFDALGEEDMLYFAEHYAYLYEQAMALNDALTGNESAVYAEILYDPYGSNVVITLTDKVFGKPVDHAEIAVTRGSNSHQVSYLGDGKYAFTRSGYSYSGYSVVIKTPGYSVTKSIARDSTRESYTVDTNGPINETFKMYYYIAGGKFPDTYAGSGSEGDYGPSSNDTPFALLTVDINGLRLKAKENGSPVVYASGSDGNQWQFTPQGSPKDSDAVAKTENFWAAVLNYTANPEVLDNPVGRAFFGYALKDQGNRNSPSLHLDGFLAVELPVYMLELYYGSSNLVHEFYFDSSDGSVPITMDDVLVCCEEEIGRPGAVAWENRTDTQTNTRTGVYEASGRRYRVTVSKVSTDKNHGSVSKENIVYYSQNQYNNYYLTKYNISVEDIGGVPYPITVTKVWNDEENKLGLRTESVTVRLMVGTSVVSTAVLSADNSWSHTFPNLEAVDRDGKLIEYRVEEEAVPYYIAGYTGDRVKGFTVTNTINSTLTQITENPGRVFLSGTKTWDDQNDAALMRPGSITVVLYADGKEYARQEVSAPDWTFLFDVTDVPNVENVRFTLEELEVPNYALTHVTHPRVEFHSPSGAGDWTSMESCSTMVYENNPDSKTVVAASLTSGQVLIWSADALAQFERDHIQKSLQSLNGIGNPKGYVFISGEGVSGDYGLEVDSQKIEFFGSNIWKKFWTGTYNRGSSETTAGSLTNTLANDTLRVQKVWNDDDNRDALRPDSVSMQLYKTVNGVKTAVGTPVAVTAATQWTHQWTGLARYENGAVITYSAEETQVPAGYTAESFVDEAGRYVIRNTYVPEQIQIKATKRWEDNNDQDNMRPESVTLTLLADGVSTDVTVTLTEAGQWTADIPSLPRYRNEGGRKVEIVYTLEERTLPEGYTADVGNAANNYTVTNTHVPATRQITVQKIWEDGNDQDGKRPDSVVAVLKGDDGNTYEGTLTPGSNWRHTFTVPVNYNKGTAITYTVDEKEVPAGYTKTVDNSTYTITNTHEPEKALLSVVKEWNDANNNDGVRPYAVAIALLRNGAPVSQTDIAAYNPANRNPIILTADASGNWTGGWQDVPLYADGHKITYTTVETGVYMTAADLAAGNITNVSDMAYKYTFVHDSYDRVNHISKVVNSYTPQRTTLNVQKTWLDGNNQDHSQPDSVTFRLWMTTDPSRAANEVPSEANGWQPVLDAEGNQQTATFRRQSNGAWTDVDFTNLMKYSGGRRIYYSVTEDAVTGYTTTYHLDKDTEVVTVTNTHQVEKTSATVTKIWNDDSNRDALRPDSVTLNLYGISKQVPVQTVTLTAANLDNEGNWSYTFTNLDKNYNGTPITYTIDENAVDGYTAETTGNVTDGFVVTNTHTPASTDISFRKVWNDDSNRDGIRPRELTVTLYADGAALKTMNVTAAEGWRGTFANLPANKLVDGKAVPIVYTVGEAAADVPAGYTAAVTGSAADGFVITNTHELETVSYTAHKVWEDGNNQDGKRPASVVLSLYANNVKVEGKTATLTGENGWEYTWTGLKKNENGTPIAYTVDEESVPQGYTKSVWRDTVTNTYVPETISVRVTKDWQDNNNQDGIRPSLVKVYLVTDGVQAEHPVELYTHSGWTHVFTNLPKYANGKEITYGVKEVPVAGYTSAAAAVDVAEGDTVDKAFQITNTHTPEKTSVAVTKKWDDADNQDGKRPQSVTVRLKKGDTVVAAAEVKETDNWTYTFANLDKYAGGSLINYTVEEEQVSDYNAPVITGSAAGGYTITNSRAVEKTSVKVTKVWADDEDRDGKRPVRVAVTLMANGESVQSVYLNAANLWTHTFSNLNKNSGGAAISYTVVEAVPEGYTAVTTGDAADGYTITNTHTPETISIKATKIWDDEGDQDKIRPATVTLHLMADGDHANRPATISATGGWTYTWSGLHKYAGGREITYTVTEERQEKYTSLVEPMEDSTVTKAFKITNSYEPEKTNVTVEKIWNDSNDQDGKRPGSVTVLLWKSTAAQPAANEMPSVENGWTRVLGTDGNQLSKELSAANGWIGTFIGLDKKDNGVDIHYSATETTGSAAYTVAVHRDDANDFVTLTNTHTPEKTSVTVTKLWNDANDQDGIRPSSVEMHLLANENHTGKAATVQENAAGEWVYTWTDLPMYANGQKIDYTVKEEAVPTGYEVSGTGTAQNHYTITNTHEPEKTSVTVTKVWNDDDNRDGVRPASVSVTLKNGEVTVGTAQLTAEKGWTHTFTNLDKNSGGTAITYTVTEDAVENYNVVDGVATSQTVTAVNGQVTITNTHIPQTISIHADKVWNDANNQDGKRPSVVTVHLMANGEHTGQHRELTAANGWECSWDNLPKKKAGVDINYTLAEEAIGNGYSTKITGNAATGFTVTNTYAPEQTAVNVLKRWVDGDNQDGKRPQSITVTLLANGNAVTSAEITGANGWYHSFTGLPKYANGVEIQYTIQEMAVEGYNLPAASAVEQDRATDAIIITNTRQVEKTSGTVTKIWDDDNNRDAMRPDSVTLNLYGINKQIPLQTVTVTAEHMDDKGNWTYTFTDLDKNYNGTPIVYTVTENAVNGYTPTYTVKNNQLTITNTHVPASTDVSFRKVWNDDTNRDGIRPRELTVTLYADGAALKTMKVTAAESWRGTFTKLPANKLVDGKAVPIVYTVGEAAADVPAGYTAAVTGSVADGFVITNTHKVEETSLDVVKIWEDQDNNDGIRPYAIVVTLLDNGVPAQIDGVVNPMILTAADGWKGSWEHLPKNREATIIDYTAIETGMYQTAQDLADQKLTSIAASEYRVLHSYNFEQEGYNPDKDTPKITITNRYNVKTRGLRVEKIWNDDRDREGVRPVELTVALFSKVETDADWMPVLDANGNQLTVTLNVENNWTNSFTDLLVYRDGGKAVRYAAREIAYKDAAGYSREIVHGQPILGQDDQTLYEIPSYQFDYSQHMTTITNTRHINRNVSIRVQKVWNDANNQDGIRPESVTVHLYANSIATGATMVLNEENNWTASWDGLYDYYMGRKISYTVAEEDVPEGYTSVTTGNAADGYTITNSHTPEKISIPVTKVWNDKENQDGIRPSFVTVTLWAGNTQTTKVLTLNAANNWRGTFEDLDKNAGGKPIQYSVVEPAISGYNVVDGQAQALRVAAENGAVVITNNREVDKTTYTVKKVWDDANNQDGYRPDKITVHLLKNGTHMGEDYKAEITAADGWTHTWTELEKNSAGKPVTYTAYEEAIAPGTPREYTATYNRESVTHVTITNAYIPEVANFVVNKIWNDDNNRDRLRPASVTVTLQRQLADGTWENVRDLVLNEENGWKAYFLNLPKYSAGQFISYRAVEQQVQGYEAPVYALDSQNHTETITNIRKPDTTKIHVSKTWIDMNNNDGVRPDSITVQLYANGVELEGRTAVLSESNSWKYDFLSTETDPLYVNDNGKAIRYSVAEVGYTADGQQHTGVAEHYKASYKQGPDAWSLEIVNSYVIQKKSLKVVKIWNDDGDRDGLRPADITVRLLSDGNDTGRTLVLNRANNWTGVWEDLPVYKNQGAPIAYTTEEVEIPEGYTSGISSSSDKELHIANTHTPAVTAISVAKTWEDADNQDGLRPEGILVQLYANGVALEGRTVVLSESNGWKHDFVSTQSEPLYVCVAGQTIAYTVEEVGYVKDGVTVQGIPNGYKAAVTGTQAAGYTVTNTHIPETVSIPVVKHWEDNHDQDGKRPHTVQIALMDGETQVSTMVLEAENNWTGTFADLPVYRVGKTGEKITYTVAEIGYKMEVGEETFTAGIPAGYTGSVTGSQTEGFTVTNTHEIETITVTATKVWTGNEESSDKRPAQIELHLLKNGEHIGTAAHKQMDKASGWLPVSWENLPRYEDGYQIRYVVTEEPVNDYSTSYHTVTDKTTGNIAVTVTNTYTPGRRSVVVEKMWNDIWNQDNLRPESVRVALYENGTATDTMDISRDENWIGVFEDQIDKINGVPVEYTVKEIGYTDDSGTYHDGPVYGENSVTYSVDAHTGNLAVVNHRVPNAVSVSVEKVWSDKDNQDNIRPAAVQVTLYKNGEPLTEYSYYEIERNSSNAITGVTKCTLPGVVTLDAVNNQWKYTFEHLDEHHGIAVDNVYTVVETGYQKNAGDATFVSGVPEGYTATVTGNQKTGYTITNSYTPETTEFTVNKVWEDDNNRDGLRPASVTVTLQHQLADGTWKDVKDLVLKAEDGWQGKFLNLPKYSAGRKIAYRVQEQQAAGYELPSYELDAEANTATVTNTRKVSTTAVHVSKTWDDMDNNDGKRPDAIFVQLYADGIALEHRTAVLDAIDGWKYDFVSTEEDPLYVNKAGKPIVYSVSEIAYAVDGDWFLGIPEGYEVSYKEGTDAWSLKIVNTHEIEKQSVSVTKVWEDDSDRDGIRPAEITVKLLSDGNFTGRTLTLNDANNWTGTWTDLPVYKNQGQKIVYTTEEAVVPAGYTSVLSFPSEKELLITNTHAPETTGVQVSKTWEDEDNNDGKRPDSILVQLYANGVALEGRTVLLNAGNGWRYDFVSSRELPLYVYDAGQLIRYSVAEVGYVINGVQYQGIPEGYQADYTGTSYNLSITNSRASEKIAVATAKVWSDGNNVDGKRPDQVKVTLMKGDAAVETVVLNGANNWTYRWNNLYRYQGGSLINYTILEEAVADYTVSYEKATDASGNVQITVTNTHTPEVWKTNITKVWKNDNSHWRPNFVTVQLYKNGVAYGNRIRLHAENGWAYPVELPMYQNGEPIDWTVREVSVPLGYEVKYDQQTLTITNRLLTVLSNPASGDDFNLGLWTSVLGTSGAGMLALLFLGKKKKSGKHSK